MSRRYIILQAVLSFIGFVGVILTKFVFKTSEQGVGKYVFISCLIVFGLSFTKFLLSLFGNDIDEEV